MNEYINTLKNILNIEQKNYYRSLDISERHYENLYNLFLENAIIDNKGDSFLKLILKEFPNNKNLINFSYKKTISNYINIYDYINAKKYIDILRDFYKKNEEFKSSYYTTQIIDYYTQIKEYSEEFNMLNNYSMDLIDYYIKVKDYSKAIDNINKSIELNNKRNKEFIKDNYIFYLKLFDIYYDLNDETKMLENYKKALELNFYPSCSHTKQKLGNFYYQKKDFKTSTEYFSVDCDKSN
ncbi:MAG: hypothetical protein U0354_05545 [Candidatus Sericytochromatia bacterium]